MTQDERAKLVVDRMMHDAHLRYQSQQLRPDTTRGTLPCPEERGITRQPSRRELNVVWLPEWSSHLRPNFWKAYFETLTYMAK